MGPTPLSCSKAKTFSGHYAIGMVSGLLDPVRVTARAFRNPPPAQTHYFIYRDSPDHPEKYAVIKEDDYQPCTLHIVAESLEEARAAIPAGLLLNQGRLSSYGPFLKESWHGFISPSS